MMIERVYSVVKSTYCPTHFTLVFEHSRSEETRGNNAILASFSATSRPSHGRLPVPKVQHSAVQLQLQLLTDHQIPKNQDLHI